MKAENTGLFGRIAHLMLMGVIGRRHRERNNNFIYNITNREGARSVRTPHSETSVKFCDRTKGILDRIPLEDAAH